MQPIHRALYRAQARPGLEGAARIHLSAQGSHLAVGHDPGQLLTASLFQWGSHFFAYWESVGEIVSPETLFGEPDHLLLPWPGAAQPRTFAPMMDIYHCMAPAGLEHWQRKQPVQRLQARVARLQPKMVSSYIFYHYQMQEERPGNFDKYCLIGLHEDLIFFYQEVPAVVERPAPAGKLATTNTPDDWHGTMFPHFHLWDDAPEGQKIWRNVEVVFHL